MLIERVGEGNPLEKVMRKTSSERAPGSRTKYNFKKFDMSKINTVLSNITVSTKEPDHKTPVSISVDTEGNNKDEIAELQMPDHPNKRSTPIEENNEKIEAPKEVRNSTDSLHSGSSRVYRKILFLNDKRVPVVIGRKSDSGGNKSNKSKDSDSTYYKPMKIIEDPQRPVVMNINVNLTNESSTQQPSLSPPTSPSQINVDDATPRSPTTSSNFPQQEIIRESSTNNNLNSMGNMADSTESPSPKNIYYFRNIPNDSKVKEAEKAFEKTMNENLEALKFLDTIENPSLHRVDSYTPLNNADISDSGSQYNPVIRRQNFNRKKDFVKDRRSWHGSMNFDKDNNSSTFRPIERVEPICVSDTTTRSYIRQPISRPSTDYKKDYLVESDNWDKNSVSSFSSSIDNFRLRRYDSESMMTIQKCPSCHSTSSYTLPRRFQDNMQHEVIPKPIVKPPISTNTFNPEFYQKQRKNIRQRTLDYLKLDSNSILRSKPPNSDIYPDNDFKRSLQNQHRISKSINNIDQLLIENEHKPRLKYSYY